MNNPLFPNPESGQTPSRAEIYGLATLAGHAGTRRDLRIKAIRALARIPDQNAIRVLGEMALWEEDNELRNEAYRALEATFGDDLPEVLEGIRQELTGQWASPPQETDAAEEESYSVYEVPSVPAPGPNPPQRMEGTPVWLLWLVIGILVIAGVTWVLLAR